MAYEEPLSHLIKMKNYESSFWVQHFKSYKGRNPIVDKTHILLVDAAKIFALRKSLTAKEFSFKKIKPRILQF